MHTTVAWSKALTMATAFAKLDAVIDRHIKTYTTMIYISDYNNLVGSICCGGADLLEARFVSPSLRRVNPFYIAPAEIEAFPVEPIAHLMHPESPVKLDTDEALEAEVRGTAVGDKQATTVAFLAPGAVIPMKGEIFTINCVFNAALVLNTWEYSEITFPDALPVGSYKVVGARVIKASAVAFRLVPIGEPYRPGGICVQAVDDLDPDFQRFGRFGHWCSFTTVQPPGIEILGGAAVAAADIELYLDVIKTS